VKNESLVSERIATHLYQRLIELGNCSDAALLGEVDSIFGNKWVTLVAEALAGDCHNLTDYCYNTTQKPDEAFFWCSRAVTEDGQSGIIWCVGFSTPESEKVREMVLQAEQISGLQFPPIPAFVTMVGCSSWHQDKSIAWLVQSDIMSNSIIQGPMFGKGSRSDYEQQFLINTNALKRQVESTIEGLSLCLGTEAAGVVDLLSRAGQRLPMLHIALHNQGHFEGSVTLHCEGKSSVRYGAFEEVRSCLHAIRLVASLQVSAVSQEINEAFAVYVFCSRLFCFARLVLKKLEAFGTISAADEREITAALFMFEWLRSTGVVSVSVTGEMSIQLSALGTALLDMLAQLESVESAMPGVSVMDFEHLAAKFYAVAYPSGRFSPEISALFGRCGIDIESIQSRDGKGLVS
jgi:hypothetical protein